MSAKEQRGPQQLTLRTERIKRLADDIARHRALYESGCPEISDADYDALEVELSKLAPLHPVLKVVGFQSASSARKVEHQEPMLSLNKTYDLKELLTWAEEQDLVGTWKVDGVSLSLIYLDGNLSLAKTRGNGRMGEDVTEKILWIPDVPHRLAVSGKVEVRGELYCHEDQFAKLAQTMVSLNLERPSSPRNIVAGLLGRKTQHVLLSYFNFLAFDAKFDGPTPPFRTEFEKLSWLQGLHFALPSPELMRGPEMVAAYLAKVKTAITDSSIGLDGAVFTFNDLRQHQELGHTAHHPRFKLSFKWQGETAVSTIRRIDWATSRLGIVTPVAVIDPVYLSGAQISNVTLHNAGHLKAYDLKVGTEIELVRSGEVIPKFLRVITAMPGDHAWIDHCPSCGGVLNFDEVRLTCPNSSRCQAQKMQRILNWIKAVEIDDLSEKRLVSLMELKLVAEAKDLYKLSKDDLLRLPLTKEKMADKLIKNIEASRAPTLARFLVGLGIEGGGLTTWENLLQHFPSLEALQEASVEAIAAIDGFAERSAVLLVTGLKERQDDIAELLAAGVRPHYQAPLKSAGAFAGKSVAITGTLSRPREDIEQLLKAAGFKVASSVSAKTFALISNESESASSKTKKAKELGVAIWSEERLMQELKQS